MAILDSLKQMLGMGGGAGGMPDMSSLTSAAMQLINSHGGLNGLVSKLSQGGLASQVSSWVGTGANQSVDAAQIKSALGPDILGQLAAKTGIQTDQLSGHLANFLPGLIDKITPNGAVDDRSHSLLNEGASKLMSMLSNK